MKYFIKYKALFKAITLFFILSFGAVYAQTPGLIYETASVLGRAVLDSNEDGFVSLTAAGSQCASSNQGFEIVLSTKFGVFVSDVNKMNRAIISSYAGTTYFQKSKAEKPISMGLNKVKLTERQKIVTDINK